jgi:hypothetical protein
MPKKYPVIGLKLITGEDIISHAQFEELNRAWVLFNPGLLVGMTNSAGAPSVGITDYIPFTTNKVITISERNILYTYNPDNEMITGYHGKLDSEELPKTENIVPFTRK